jgi:hypothetical protein
MDLIERLTGLSPDGGNSSLEVLYVIAFVALIAAIVVRWRWRDATGGPWSWRRSPWRRGRR